MSDHRYSLEPYQSGKPTRYTCPSCGQPKKFTRYIDQETGLQIADEVGKCDRANSCGYHFTPREYFASYGKPTDNETDVRSARITPIVKQKPQRPAVYIPVEVLQQSRKRYEQNAYVTFLEKHFDPATIIRLISLYQIGTSSHWDGACVFWWINLDGHVTGGQVVLFGADGHTTKYKKADGSTQRLTRPIHTAIKYQCEKQGKSLPDWLATYIEQREYFPSLFGLHLLRLEPADKPIALVEAPATAIVASAYFPAFIWLAVGSLDWLNEKRLQPLQGRRVFLFPDLNGYEKWQAKANKLNHIADFTVSDLLERLSTDEEKKAGLDLRDYLLQFPVADFNSSNDTQAEAEPIKDSVITETAAAKPLTFYAWSKTNPAFQWLGNRAA